MIKKFVVQSFVSEDDLPPVSPEKKLLIAILERSFLDIIGMNFQARVDAQKFFNGWFPYDGPEHSKYEFSFERICETLNLDTSLVRRVANRAEKNPPRIDSHAAWWRHINGSAVSGERKMVLQKRRLASRKYRAEVKADVGVVGRAARRQSWVAPADRCRLAIVHFGAMEKADHTQVDLPERSQVDLPERSQAGSPD